MSWLMGNGCMWSACYRCHCYHSYIVATPCILIIKHMSWQDVKWLSWCSQPLCTQPSSSQFSLTFSSQFKFCNGYLAKIRWREHFEETESKSLKDITATRSVCIVVWYCGFKSVLKAYPSQLWQWLAYILYRSCAKFNTSTRLEGATATQLLI